MIACRFAGATGCSRWGAASARRPRSCFGTFPTFTSRASTSTTSSSPRRAASSRRFRGRRIGSTSARWTRRSSTFEPESLRLRVSLLGARARAESRARARRGAPRAVARRARRVQRGVERDVLRRPVQPRHASLLDGLQRPPDRARRRSVRRRQARKPPLVRRLSRRRDGGRRRSTSTTARPASARSSSRTGAELLLSGAPALLEAGKVSQEVVDGMTRELDRVARDPNSVFFYSFIQARARAW